PLEGGAAGRAAAYREALHAFAGRLSQADPQARWPDILAGLDRDVAAADMTDPALGSVLTLHITALNAPLQASPARVAATPGDQPEELLLNHEQQYWEDSAKARGLLYQRATLRRAVAAATLCGAGSEDEALATLERVVGVRDRSEDGKRGGDRK